jgi:hypothetical protein
MNKKIIAGFLVLVILTATTVFASVIGGIECYAKAEVTIHNGKDYIKILDKQKCESLNNEDMYEVEYMYTPAPIETPMLLGVEYGSTKALKGSINWIRWTLPNKELLTNTSDKPWMF